MQRPSTIIIMLLLSLIVLAACAPSGPTWKGTYALSTNSEIQVTQTGNGSSCPAAVVIEFQGVLSTYNLVADTCSK